MHHYFFKVVVDVIIIDLRIQVTVIDSRAILVAVTSECCAKRVICKTWTGLSAGTLANNADSDQTPRLISVCSVCLNYWKLRVK